MVVGRRVHVPASLGSALGDFFGWPRHQRRVVPMVGDTLRRLQSVDFVRLCVHHSVSLPCSPLTTTLMFSARRRL